MTAAETKGRGVKLFVQFGAQFFEEVQERQIGEVRGCMLTSPRAFLAGGHRLHVMGTYLVLTAFDPKEQLVVEAVKDLGVTGSEQTVKAHEDALKEISAEASTHGILLKDGRWIPA